MATDFLNQEIEAQCKAHKLSSYDRIYLITRKSNVRRWVLGTFIGIMVFLFLPWTQNIRARGTVTTLRQEQRPQEIPTIIPGKVARWYVKEGDFVSAGDTIIQITEVKDDYLDPQLLLRTKEQIDAKAQAVESYRGKTGTAGQQIEALKLALDLKVRDMDNKISQQRLKISSDSMELMAAINDLNIKTEQFRRQRVMYDSGLASLVQLEQRNQAYQESSAKKTSAEIKFNNSRQEYARLQIERNGEIQQYLEKISKAEGDRFTAISQAQTGEGEIAKLRNQYMNYTVRAGLYTITAPQSGQVVKAKKAGIGEILKDGDIIVEIVPQQIDYAIEMFVRPVDLPLLARGQKVRLLFDGFPAIVFSGWPTASYGTFGGEVAAVESSVSDNGKFRVLVREDSTDKPWPRQLMMGTGAQGIALLKDVPIWYELWRNINGFPPDYYQPAQNGQAGQEGKK
ncbi:MAG: HlyD family secretion protein [Chitinophagaceae bacterium]|jgi:multidrug efflux pump subunit AcrA (membrane-fusion protein)|nr:HlyD family secretion protein [Chitinophagaceae bacterium]